MMIYDSLDNASLYFDSERNSRLYKAIRFVREFDVSAADGRYEIEGEDIFAIVSTYKSKSSSGLKFEAHRKYADIQVVLKGHEMLGVANINDLEVTEPYSDDADVAFYSRPEIYTSVVLKKGLFALLYPDDVHQPGAMIDESCEVRKLVVKVKL